MTTNKHKVIVIGAGIAGIKTSVDLTANGVDNIVIEGRDRLGGRLHTITTKNGNKVDLGASWFHDSLINPLLTKSKEKGNVDYYFDNGKFSVFDKNIASEIDSNYKLTPVVEEIKCYLKNFYSTKEDHMDDVSLREACFNYLEEKKEYLTPDQLKLVPALLRYFEMWIGSSWDILSARSIAADEHYGRDALVLNGYTTVYNNELEELAGHSNLASKEELVSKGKIQVSKIVKKIIFNEIEQEITLKVLNAKDQRYETFKCDYLVCCVPLSVLKMNNNDTQEIASIEWIPALPKKFTDNLSNMSFSALGKVFLEFDECFWPCDTDRFYCLPEYDQEFEQYFMRGNKTVDLKFNTNRREEKHLTKQPAPWSSPVLFMNLCRSTGKPLILALISNPHTKWIESDPQNRAWPFLKPLMAKLSGKKQNEIPSKPSGIYCSEWTSDPFARGSYTGVTIFDEFEEGIDALINPPNIFDNRVSFAGEHTVFVGNGCAHGAWESGKREAGKLIKKLYKPNL